MLGSGYFLQHSVLKVKILYIIWVMAVQVDDQHNLRNWKRQKAPQLMGFGFALEFKIVTPNSSEVSTDPWK
jgi:hypothetical protein